MNRSEHRPGYASDRKDMEQLGVISIRNLKVMVFIITPGCSLVHTMIWGAQ